LDVGVEESMVHDCPPEGERYRAVLALGLWEALAELEDREPAVTGNASLSMLGRRVVVLNRLSDTFLRKRAAVPCMVFPFVAATPLDAVTALVLPSPEQRAIVRRCVQGLPLYSRHREGRIACVADRASRVYGDQPALRVLMPTAPSSYLAFQHLQYAIRKRRFKVKLRTLTRPTWRMARLRR
jgi:hypothetical protein